MDRQETASRSATSRGLKTLLGLFAATALAACGGGVDEKQAEGSTTSQVAPPAPPARPEPPKPPAPPVRDFAWPEDHAVIDPNRYVTAQSSDALNSATYKNGPYGGPGSTAEEVANAAIDRAVVSETPAVKHHRMTSGGKTIDYTATAGHLIAWGPGKPEAPNDREAKASIFYMAYTRDDLPKDTRPVTFLVNGGPGEPSIWLHLGSWAPKRLKVDAPKVLDGPDMPDSFPLIDSDQTLMEESDLVFVDVVAGTGYSQAIAPHKNRDFWGTDADAELFRDFITAYVNRYNRQSSPKYLMGESYSGIRAPIVGNLLVQAGARDYAPDPSGKKPIVLSGVVLQSPVLDYNTKDGLPGAFPTVGKVADYFGKSTARGTKTDAEYTSDLRSFTAGKYAPALNSKISSALALELNGIGGWPVSNLTGKVLKNAGLNFPSIGKLLYPNEAIVSVNYYDGRMVKTGKLNYTMWYYEDAAYYGAIRPLLLDQFGYRNADERQLYGASPGMSPYWDYTHRGEAKSRSTPDLVELLVLAPEVKALVLHGYHDSVTPFYQTELDLASVGLLDPKNPGKDGGRVTMKIADGGHMEYATEASRPRMLADLKNFYVN